MELIIIATHQTYTKAYAGGYIRIIEFLKHVPSGIDYTIIDIAPSVYRGLVPKKKIVEFNIPYTIKFLIKYAFPIGVFFERLYTGIRIYQISNSMITMNNVKAIYVPIGEFLHLYLPAIFLKKKHSKIKIVVDILNFEVIDFGIKDLFIRFKKKSATMQATVLTLIHYCTYIAFKKTLNEIDYVFTVSPKLIREIKKVYKKNTIDYTPSGVATNFKITNNEKKYLGVYIGRITVQKGILNLINTWRQVVNKESNAKLAIGGLVTPDVLKIINEKIIKLNLSNNIDVFGEVSDTNKHKILSQSKLFIHLANYEPLFPVIGILEGLIHGLPVVAFDMPVLREEISRGEKNKYIFIVKNGSIKDATNAIIRYTKSSKSEKINFSRESKIYAKKFGWEKIAKKEFKIIKQQLKN